MDDLPLVMNQIIQNDRKSQNSGLVKLFAELLSIQMLRLSYFSWNLVVLTLDIS